MPCRCAPSVWRSREHGLEPPLIVSRVTYHEQLIPFLSVLFLSFPSPVVGDEVQWRAWMIWCSGRGKERKGEERRGKWVMRCTGPRHPTRPYRRTMPRIHEWQKVRIRIRSNSEQCFERMFVTKKQKDTKLIWLSINLIHLILIIRFLTHSLTPQNNTLRILKSNCIYIYLYIFSWIVIE